MPHAFNYRRPDGYYIHVTPELWNRYVDQQSGQPRTYGATIPYLAPDCLETRTFIRHDVNGQPTVGTMVPWFGYREIQLLLIPLRAWGQVLEALDAGDHISREMAATLRDSVRVGDRPDLEEPEPCSLPYEEWAYERPSHRRLRDRTVEEAWIPGVGPNDFMAPTFTPTVTATTTATTTATGAGTTTFTVPNTTFTRTGAINGPLADTRWMTHTAGDLVMPANFALRAYDEDGAEITPAQVVTTFNQTRGITVGNPNATARVVIDDFERRVGVGLQEQRDHIIATEAARVRARELTPATNPPPGIDATTEQIDRLVENARIWMQQTGGDYTDAILPGIPVTPDPNTILVNEQTYADIIEDRIVEENT